MPQYRIFSMSREKKIASNRYVNCATDDAARTLAEAMVGMRAGGEVWQGKRLVAVITDPSAPDNPTIPRAMALAA